MLVATPGGRPPVTPGERRESAEDEVHVPLATGALPSRASQLFAPEPDRPARVRFRMPTRRRRPRTLIDVDVGPMSMYTRLLDAALEQRPPRHGGASRDNALDEVWRCGAELELGLPGGDVDTVSGVLALQVGYDVALLELAAVAGIDSGPSRFEQPERERDRLRWRCATWASTLTRRTSGPSRTCRRQFPGAPESLSAQVPEASERASCAERSLRRAAKVAAWVRRSMPSLASRFET